MATLADLQTSFDNATAALSSATANKNSSYTVASDAYNAVGKCVGGKGSTTNCPNGQPLGGNVYGPFLSSLNPGHCKICNSLPNCTTDCCSEQTCKDRINDYNSKLSSYNSNVGNYNTAKSNFDAAKIALEAHPDYNAAAIQAKGTSDTRKTVIIVLVVAAVVVGVIWFLKSKKII